MKCVIFDLDGVIIDSKKAYTEAQKEICFLNNLDIKDLDWNRFIGFNSYEIFINILNKTGNNNNKLSAKKLNKQFTQKIESNNFIKKIKLFKGVKDIIGYLKRRNYIIGLVTSNTFLFVESVLRNNNLKNDFDFIVSANDVKKVKPHPDPYITFLNKANLKSSQCIAIEDSNTGAASAKEARILSIGIGEERIFNADIKINNISSIKEILTKIENNPYTIFTIKNDSIKRGIEKDLMNDLERYYKIIDKRKVKITPEIVSFLKEGEWTNNWKPYPSNYVKKKCYNYEANLVLVLLCKIKSKGVAIELGGKIKGDHHLPHLCSGNTIRGKYSDESIIKNIYTDNQKVSFLCDSKKNKISTVPNIIHSVEDYKEFWDHLLVYFPKFLESIFSNNKSIRL